MTETSIDLTEIQQIVNDIEANFDLQAAEQNLQSTGTDLSQLQSIGAYGNLTFSPPAGYASGSLTVVVLFDRSDTAQKNCLYNFRRSSWANCFRSRRPNKRWRNWVSGNI